MIFKDGSDELNCKKEQTIACKKDEFSCKNNHQCIPQSWVCDNENDCTDDSDEDACMNKDCEPWMFKCGDGRCVYSTWRCGKFYISLENA